MAPSTKERLITAGLELFTRHGIGQVGLDGILSQAGLTKTTFYNHFSSKEELLREAIALQGNRLVGRLESGGHGDNAHEQLLAVFDVFEQLHAEGHSAFGLVLNALLEYPETSDPTHAAAARCKALLGEVLRSLSGRLGVANPAALADQLGLVVDGVLLNFQATRDPRLLHEGRVLATQVINAASGA